MNADPFLFVLTTPIGLFACLSTILVSMLVWLGLRRRWSTPGYPGSARRAERVVLIVSTLAALLVVVGAGVLVQQRDARAAMQRELVERSAQAQALRTQIGSEIDAARKLLADRAVDKIAQEKLAEARAELARFIPFQDPRILQMVALIDQELAVRESLRQRALLGAGQ